MDTGIRFLVATDVHLGHREKHPVRHNDSYEGFEQVIAHAKEQQVDFLLLGGDLFDEVNPSKECFFRCLNILKANVFGNRRAALHVSLNGRQYRSNLEDPDLHISLPIFTIHGNHDYPTNEFGKISACDLLQASNYVNYFGKHLNLQKIVIRPLIITKSGSNVKIALYGLGYIKDQILSQLFEDKKVAFEQPEGNITDYLCIFVFHQNRYKKGFRAGTPIHQSFNPRNIPQWMGLVIWGHQHEAIYRLEYEFDRPVYQPGSTVLTSYIDSEAIKKQCLLVHALPGGKYELTSILLQKSYRPMRCLSFQYQLLKAEYGEDFDLFAFLEKQVIKTLQEMAGGKRPIIRIKLQATGLADTVRARHVQTRFADKVANGQKILIFWKRKVQKKPNMNDDQMLSRLKSRQPLRTHLGIADELQNIMRQNFERVTTHVLHKQSMADVVNYLAKTENANSTDIIRKKCAELQKRKLKTSQEQLINMARDKQMEFKRCLKYNMDVKEFTLTGKFDKSHYTGCNTNQQFLALRPTFSTQNKFTLQCKLMEEQFEEANINNQSNTNIANTSKTSSNSNSNSHSHSIMSRPKKEEERDSSVEILERSDSEDCCSRAEKTQFDEKGNKMRYQEAEEKLNNAKIAKNKKSALANTKQELKSQQKSMKNVRWSDDFM